MSVLPEGNGKRGTIQEGGNRFSIVENATPETNPRRLPHPPEAFPASRILNAAALDPH